ncbi:MAG: helix-turn-helix domain-containing protein [Planctomycetota bacterium]|nr:helix-turn-helix domain-containing protein [Planctomycetota bacterium]
MTESAIKPRKTHLIRDGKQLEVLTSPLRSRILLCLSSRGPLSAREIAVHIGQASDNMHYHLRTLSASGLVRVREKRSIGPRSESVYEAVAREFRVDRSNQSPRFRAAIQKILRSGLRLIERRHEAALEKPEFATGSRKLELQFMQQDVCLNPAEFKEFLRRLDGARKYIANRHSPQKKRHYTVTTIITPEVIAPDDS